MNKAPKILVIDDGDRYVELFFALMRDYRYATRCELAGPCWECPHAEGCELTHAHDWSEAEQALARHQDLDVVLLDLSFDLPPERLLPSDLELRERRRSEGLRILSQIRRKRQDLPVVLMTRVADLDLGASDSLQADEYLSFAGDAAFDVRALSLLIERIVAAQHFATLNDSISYEWGSSAVMGRLRRQAMALRRTSLPVLLLGETGTGKSAMAERVLHAGAGRGRFVHVDLSAMPETLMAAELFGSAAGAFSGAVNRAGRFEEADGGTLFLDEIGNLPSAAQRMLLLALQDGRVTRLGESRPRQVEVKLIAATNADLAEQVQEGTFRSDLYARLNPAARLLMPPLRERLSDLDALISMFCAKRFAQGPDRRLLADYQEAAALGTRLQPIVQLGNAPSAQGASVVFALAPASRRLLSEHHWPGNVRELELLVGNALLMTLADATCAAEAGRTGDMPRLLPIPESVIRQLLERSWVSRAEHKPRPTFGQPSEPQEPQEHFRDIARDLERALMRRLFLRHGDLKKVATELLVGDPAANVRRLRTRFQQLGLSVRELRKERDDA